VAIYIYQMKKKKKVMSWRTNKSEINGPQMIDIRLVNDGRRLMNSKEEKTACFFVILTFDRIIKKMNDIRTLKIIRHLYMLRSTNTHI
jgi:hypothetical protein